MAHAQKPDFVFRRKRTSPFKSVVASVHSTTDNRGVRISGSNTGYTMFRGSVKGTGYTLHSPVSPSLPLPCVTVCHHISAGLLKLLIYIVFDIPFPDLSQGVQTKSGKMLVHYFTFKTHSSSDSLASNDLSGSTINKRKVIDESVKSVFSSIFHILSDS